MKIDATTLLLIAAAGVAVYLITRPSTPQVVQPVYNPALYGQNFVGSQINPTAQDISAGGGAVSSVISALSKGGVI